MKVTLPVGACSSDPATVAVSVRGVPAYAKLPSLRSAVMLPASVPFAEPLPVSRSDCGAAPLMRTRARLSALPCAVGANRIATVHWAAACRVKGGMSHVPLLAVAKPFGRSTASTCKGAAPPFFSVTVCAALLLPAGTLPKASDGSEMRCTWWLRRSLTASSPFEFTATIAGVSSDVE